MSTIPNNPAGDTVSITVTSTDTTKVHGEKVVSVLDKRTDIEVTYVTPESVKAITRADADADGTNEEQPSHAVDEAPVSTITRRVEHTKRVITMNKVDFDLDDIVSEDIVDRAQLLQELMDAGLQSRGLNETKSATKKKKDNPIKEVYAQSKANQQDARNLTSDSKKGLEGKRDNQA
ncbi:hypothetical protein BC835DRAFT_898909 [Cytidiella melzeri]|nr:hypothetical protein BC835DRAFT_898909 [Cytidiella melzeri]